MQSINLKPIVLKGNGFFTFRNTPQYFAVFSTNHNENILFDYMLVTFF